MAKRQAELMKGTLDLLVLKTLELEPRHGVGVADRIRQTTNGTFVVKAGSLFPALHRMERAGWLKSFWDVAENGRRARFYQLTALGRKQLESETAKWQRVLDGLAAALRTPSRE